MHGILSAPLSTIVGLGLIAIITFINSADVAIDKEKVGLDMQVMLKLAGIGFAAIYGGIGFLTDRRVRDLVQSFPVFWVVIIIAMYFVSTPFSIDPKISLASTLSVVAILLLTIRALLQIGIMPVLNAIFVGMGLFNIFSWVVFFAWPEVGVLKEALPDGKFAHRMSGLAHSNVLGQYAGLTVVLGMIMFFTYKRKSKARLGLIAIALGALVCSLSRTSMVATLVALAVAYRRVFFKREYLQRYVVAAMVGIFALMVISTQVDLGAKIKEKMTLISKSGNADELTSATGRSEIWAYSIRLIGERPLIGYGAATSKYYLARYSLYTHNMILNVAFSTGIIGGFACLMMVLGRIRAMFSISHPLADGILIFIIVNGLFENVIFAVLAGMPTMVWIMSLSWPLQQTQPLVGMTNEENTRDASIDLIDAHVVILNNYLRRHHVVAYKEIARRVRKLTILLSVDMEPDRHWEAQWDGLDVIVQKSKMFTKQLKALKPDVILSYEMGMRTLLCSFYRMFRRDCRLVMVGNMSERIERERGIFRKALRKAILCGVDFFSYNGPSCKRYLQSLGVKEEKLFHFPYCIDPESVSSSPRQQNANSVRTLLYCGAMSSRKGILRFAEAARAWCEKNPGDEVRLNIAGPGELRDAIAKLSSEKFEINFLGNCDQEELRQAYQGADICVFPTLADEWGLVPIEAMASGLPVLGSIHAQSVEACVVEGENGWVFNPDSGQAIEAAFERCMKTSPEKLGEMGVSAKGAVAHISPAFSANEACRMISMIVSRKP